jgi:hypothetical protein
MNSKVKLIFIKRTGCPHCADFAPIFDKLFILLNNEKKDKGMNLEIKIFDINDENEHEDFKKNYSYINNWTNGVPSIFIDCIVDKVIKYDPIQTILPPSDKMNDNEEINKAAQQIFNNFIYKFKKFTLQLGGNNNLKYKNKYLKYKNKYLLLKNIY